MSDELHLHIHHDCPDPGPLWDRIKPLITKQHIEEMAAMSRLSEAIAALRVSVDAEKVRDVARSERDQAEIARLQALVDAGGATPEEIAELEALKADVDALDPTNPAVLQ